MTVPTYRRVFIDEPPFLGLDAGRGWIEQGVWPASWITHPSLPAAPCRLAFRLKVRVEGQTMQTVRIHATGDERYEFSLDGEPVGWGSERGTVDHWYFDTYDLSLDPGEHRLTAVVLAAGPHGLRSQMSVGPGLLLASETGGFSTGVAHWEVKILDGLSYEKPFAHDFFSIGWNTVQDASRMERDVFSARSDGWEPAKALHPGSTFERRNRHPHIHLLAPAILPAAWKEPFRGGQVRYLSRRLAGPVAGTDHLETEAEPWVSWWNDQGPFTLPPGCEQRVLIDLQDYVCAWPEMDVAGGRGSRLQVFWAESLYEGPDTNRKGDRSALEGKTFHGVGEVFLPAGDAMTFRGPFIRTGRYLQLSITVGEEPLTLKGLRLLRAEYPLEMTSRFQTGLAPVQTLIERCQRTIRASCHDSLIDGPYYEQMGWIGDTVQMALTLYTLSRDSRPVRKALEVFDQSRLPSGMIRARWPARDSAILPPYALCWITVLHDFAWWRDEPDFVRARLPSLRAVLDGFLPWIDPGSGLLRIPVGWNFTDWVPGWPHGIAPRDSSQAGSVLQWQLAWAFQQAADLEDEFGEGELAARYRRHARRIAQAAETFWDEERGLYADQTLRTSFCEHAQAYATLSGLVPGHHLSRLKVSLLQDDQLVHATDAFAHYVFEAYGRLGMQAQIWPRLERWFNHDALGLLTTPEAPEPTRSDCHGWGAHAHHHLFASLLGLRPARAGFRRLRIAPCLPAVLGSVEGACPHPEGDIRFSLTPETGGTCLKIDLPSALAGECSWQGALLPLAGGSNVHHLRF